MTTSETSCFGNLVPCSFHGSLIDCLLLCSLFSQILWYKRLSMLTWRTKWRLQSERAWELYQKQVSKVTFHFVCGHLSRKQAVAFSLPVDNSTSISFDILSLRTPMAASGRVTSHFLKAAGRSSRYRTALLDDVSCGKFASAFWKSNTKKTQELLWGLPRSTQ